MLGSSAVFEVFGRFQNLNLLVLLEDLRKGARLVIAGFPDPSYALLPMASPRRRPRIDDPKDRPLTWTDGLADCSPSFGRQSGNRAVLCSRVDEEGLSGERLLQQLEELWRERLEDAVAVQAVLHEGRDKGETAERVSNTRDNGPEFTFPVKRVRSAVSRRCLFSVDRRAGQLHRTHWTPAFESPAPIATCRSAA